MSNEHRWYRPLTLDARRYSELVQDVSTLLSSLETWVGDEWQNTRQAASTSPGSGCLRTFVLNEQTIQFSIDGREFEERRRNRIPAGHQHLQATPALWHSCVTWFPTKQSPYDLMVCTFLLTFKHHFPEMVLESTADSEFWQPAVAWYQACFPDRVVLPGPWSVDETSLYLDDVALLDASAQKIGYRVVREYGLLFLVYGHTYRTRGGKNTFFVDDAQGKRELAGYIRWLTDRQPIIDQWALQWSNWCDRPGITAIWTTVLCECWHLGEKEWLDLRKIVADSGRCVWVPRRALSTFIETPGDLERYRLLLIEDAETCAVRIEEQWNGYDNPGNPQKLPFFPVGVLRVAQVEEPTMLQSGRGAITNWSTNDYQEASGPMGSYSAHSDHIVLEQHQKDEYL